MPRLYIPSQDARDIEYAALSYVWGGDHANFTKTTASNLDDMRRQLPWNKLSKTIQDAIIITRGLGLKYLWVDALCILQKEKINDIQHMEDWSIEAARFASYYQNAVLTIAATGSESSSRGLFLESPTLEFKPGPVKYIAGIWESSVAEGLTWIAIRTSDIHTDGPIQSERVLPSWSWASNNGFIWFTFLHGPWESLIQVKTFHSRSKGPDTSGQVLEARLTLKGLFRMVDLSQLNTVYPYNKHAKEESTESEQQDTAKHKHIACMDGIKPAEPLGTHPRLCLLIGTIHELGYDPWRKVKKGVACVLEHSGHRYGEFEGYKRIGLVRLPFDEYWSEVKDVRTIELV
ncbi:unnamed protein product [Fusarium fujikuroi]|nr:unnamed protein product [Fusarium fujikuroi]